MRVTRSATRASATGPSQVQEAERSEVQVEVQANGTRGRKRKAVTETTEKTTIVKTAKKARSTVKKATKEDVVLSKALASTAARPLTASEPEALVPAVLTFSFEEAKKHLIKADSRFEDIFDRMHCKPFEHLEQVDPFRTLTHSILGQQISWLAARSITHRFVRLFDPSLPEKPVDHNKTTDFFPTAHQVATMDIPTLRTAGLSQRKAEYVLDLASRFADGRLSTKKVLAADDEELYDMLIEVRGIGRWTVDMFAMFSLRRPDILPVGDLGVQRGLLRWFLARHSSSYSVTLSPLKQLKQTATEDGTDGAQKEDDSDMLPVLNQTSKVAKQNEEPDNVGASSIPPVPALPSTPAPKGKKAKGKAAAKNNYDDTDTEEDTGVLPTPFTPSILKTLNKTSSSSDIPPLPVGLSVAELKRRLDTKKKIKGAFLTPKEMEELTEPWRPYRSLGVYYMWALAEEPK